MRVSILFHSFHVSLKDKTPPQDGEGTPLDVQVKDNGNGTYTCTYTPRKPLKHTVMVSWGGVNIPDSPFRVSTNNGSLFQGFPTQDI